MKDGYTAAKQTGATTKNTTALPDESHVKLTLPTCPTAVAVAVVNDSDNHTFTRDLRDTQCLSECTNAPHQQ